MALSTTVGQRHVNTSAAIRPVPGSKEGLWWFLRDLIGGLRGSEREARLVDGESSKISIAAACSLPVSEGSPRDGSGMGRGSGGLGAGVRH